GSACHVLLSASGLSRWSFSAAVASALSRRGLRVLVFTDSQQMAELVARIARRSYGVGFEVHRAGLMPEDRRGVEERLRRGVIPGVVATPTLELGIDIGVLDAVVLSSPPPSYAKYVQRAGRAGRRGRGTVITILGDDPIDAYYERHPEEFFEREVEPTVMEPDNEEVLRIHAAAMMMEHGRLDPRVLGERWRRAIGLLEAEGMAVRRGRWVYPDYRLVRRLLAEHGSLRGAGPQISILDERGRVIGSREMPMALYDLHPSAVYLHAGRTYRVAELDLDKRVARLRRLPDDFPFYTRPIYTVELEGFTGLEERVVDGVPASYGDMRIRMSVEGYVLRSIDSRITPIQENFPEPITWSYRTKRIVLAYPTLADRLGYERGMSGLHAVEHVLISAARVVAGAGQTDLGGMSYPSGHVGIDDSTPGGSGVARLLYSKLVEAHRVAFDIVSSCRCEDGCPRCVYSPYCGNNNRMLSRRAAAEILGMVISGKRGAPAGPPSGRPLA
ncbi:MAG: helicase-related protein, partial [Candidatus Korarchaeota archaeon]|nr:helicase-related protein [Candidatus Korarchaeota archaeon]